MHLAIVLVTRHLDRGWQDRVPGIALGDTFSSLSSFWDSGLPGTLAFCSWPQTYLASPCSCILFFIFYMDTNVQI